MAKYVLIFLLAVVITHTVTTLLETPKISPNPITQEGTEC